MTREAAELRRSLRVAALAWLAARVAVALGWLMAMVIAHHRVHRPIQLRQGLYMWDGAFYRDLARSGFSHATADAFRFFPLFPWLGRLLGWLPGVGPGPALVVIANVAALGAGVLIYQLTLFETNERGVAERAVWLLAFFPGAFTLAFAYAEGLFLVLAISAVLALRRSMPWLAAILGLLAAMTRPTGLLLAVPAFVELARRWKSSPVRSRVAQLGAFAGPVVGTAIVFVHSRIVEGSWNAPVHSQTALRGRTVFPLVRIARAVGDAFGSQRFHQGLHLAAVIGLLAAIVLSAKWLAASYTAYLTVATALFLSANNLNSVERYALNVVPIVLVAALLGRKRWRAIAIYTVCAGVFVGLTAASLVGSYVP